MSWMPILPSGYVWLAQSTWISSRSRSSGGQCGACGSLRITVIAYQLPVLGTIHTITAMAKKNAPSTPYPDSPGRGMALPAENVPR